MSGPSESWAWVSRRGIKLMIMAACFVVVLVIYIIVWCCKKCGCIEEKEQAETPAQGLADYPREPDNDPMASQPLAPYYNPTTKPVSPGVVPYNPFVNPMNPGVTPYNSTATPNCNLNFVPPSYDSRPHYATASY